MPRQLQNCPGDGNHQFQLRFDSAINFTHPQAAIIVSFCAITTKEFMKSLARPLQKRGRRSESRLDNPPCDRFTLRYSSFQITLP
jgi:hypothetical protein